MIGSPAWPYPTSACSLCGQDITEGQEFIPLTVCRYDGPRWRDNSTAILVHATCLVQRFTHGITNPQPPT